MEIPPGRVCFPPRLFLPGSASAREADSEVIYLAGYRRSFQVALPNDVPVPQFVAGDVVGDCGQRKQRKDSRWALRQVGAVSNRNMKPLTTMRSPLRTHAAQIAGVFPRRLSP